jgi:hypothetical protein
MEMKPVVFYAVRGVFQPFERRSHTVAIIDEDKRWKQLKPLMNLRKRCCAYTTAAFNIMIEIAVQVFGNTSIKKKYL